MKTRAQKEDMVSALSRRLRGAEAAIVARYRGLKVAEMEELRKRLRDSGATFSVTKLTLARLAVKDTPLESLTDALEGPVGMAVTDSDAVGAAKALVTFAKDHPALEITAGVLSGQTLSEAEIQNLATLPTLDELRAQFLATLDAPASNLVSVLAAAGGRELVGVLKAKEEKGDG